MRCMVLVHPGNKKSYEAGQMPDQVFLSHTGRFNEALVEAGVLLSGEGLQPRSKGVRVHLTSSGQKSVTNGPFAEAREIFGGFWI